MIKRSEESLPASRQGFTLIELLIVIAIIAILSALFVNYSSINIKRGRDAKRKADLESIRSGIEIYRADCNSYPSTLPLSGALNGNGVGACLSTNTYISNIPTDPTADQAYVYSSDGTTYEICASLEANPPPDVACGGSSACGTGICNYKVISP